MPELPEVETIKNGLVDTVVGQTVTSVSILLPKTFIGNADIFVGSTIDSISRRGKLLIFSVYTEYRRYALLVHLKMTGQLLFRSSTRSEYSLDQAIPPFNAPFPNKSTRVVVYFASGDVLYFNDIRTFGYMKLLPGELVHQDLFLSRLGVEPLEPTFTVAVLQKLLTCSPRQKIKYFLLDQTKIAGLGNIYTDEALFAAGILPTRLVSSLTEEEVESLYSAIIKVLSKGVLLRGSSKTSYVTLDGRAGGFLMENAVYARSGKACLVCGQTIQKTVVAGRGTHYCAYCQK